MALGLSAGIVCYVSDCSGDVEVFPAEEVALNDSEKLQNLCGAG